LATSTGSSAAATFAAPALPFFASGAAATGLASSGNSGWSEDFEDFFLGIAD
jgi:hypothetical protein